MSQRRPHLKVVVSNRVAPMTRSTSLPKQERLPLDSSCSPESSRLDSKINRLRLLRPAYVDVLESLVDDALLDLERGSR